MLPRELLAATINGFDRMDWSQKRLILRTCQDGRMAASGLSWAVTRHRGKPTAHPHAVDADVILAACAVTIGQRGDPTIVASNNVGHLAHDCEARLSTTIT
jgi:hypothetical protein